MVVLPTMNSWIINKYSTIQYNIYSCHECCYFLWFSDVKNVIILLSVECLLEQRQDKRKVREALVSNLGAKYLLFTQSHLHYSRKPYINSQTVSCNIFETRESSCSLKSFICVWSEIVLFHDIFIQRNTWYL